MLLRMLNLPGHVGVMGFIEVFENDEYYYCVMEKAAGGSLLDCLLTRHRDGVVPESEMKQVMREIIEAVSHVHKAGMLHRDIKPDNLVVRKTADPVTPGLQKERVTLIDFDHADTDYSPVSPGPKTDEALWGTTGFNAPETYLGNFSPASDLFSIGVILYLLMTGKMPYKVSEWEQEVDRMQKGLNSPKCCSPGPPFGSMGSVSPRRLRNRTPRGEDVNWVSKAWCLGVYDKFLENPIDWNCDPFPQNTTCRDLCQWLLALYPQYRPASAEEALSHPWLKGTVTAESKSDDEIGMLINSSGVPEDFLR